MRDLLERCAQLASLDCPREAALTFLRTCLDLAGADFASLVWARPRQGFYEPGTGVILGNDEAHGQRVMAWFAAGREYLRDPVNRAAHGADLEVFARRDLVTDGEWYRANHVRERQEMGLDDVLTYTRPVPGGKVFVSLHRARGERLFSATEVEAFELYSRCCAWLFLRLTETGLLGPATPSLPPRLERLLTALLGGSAEVAIAEDLGLSRHSVHKYTQQLYSAMQVHSRAELMARFIPPRETRFFPLGRGT